MENEELMFTDSEFEELIKDGSLTAEDVDEIKTAIAIADTVELLPENIMELVEKIDNIPLSENGEAVSSVLNLAKTDKDLFVKIMSLIYLVNSDAQIDPNQGTVDPLILGLSDEEYANYEKNFFESFNNLPFNKRRELLELLSSVSEEQKADLINQLKK